MEEPIKDKLHKIMLGEVQQFRNVSMYPIFLNIKPQVKHLVLKEAMAKGFVTISEVSEGGHVPELKVVNDVDMPVLILDGEELFGAKQNRVLNTTVLLKMKSTTIIPVSCTEQGRWTYRSKTFSESGIIMSPQVRRVKNRSVQYSLRSTNEFRSDQGAVWEGIHKQAAAMSIQSPTQAMRDIHEEKSEEVFDYAVHFPRLDGQCGILVFIGGRVLGLDMVTYTQAYNLLHDKLIKSYVMDAILNGNGNTINTDKAKAVQFIDDISECEMTRYKSVSHGWDVRFEGKNIIGSALEYRGSIVHCAFFVSPETNSAGDNDGMSGYSRRAAWRNNK